MNLHSGGFLVAVTDLELSTKFYCDAMELRVQASDGTSVMLSPDESDATHPWLLALRRVGGKIHLSGGSVGIRALFFRVDLADLDALEGRLRELDGFHERHDGEFYEMVSAYSPDRNALGFWAPRPNAPVEGPSFVPPSIYFLD